ncbi:peptidylprolyl isomerase [Candidatus Pelagibacter sp.]|nr:peptidylprolyl isomerase [Candidatus Pelagibacter sp.]
MLLKYFTNCIKNIQKKKSIILIVFLFLIPDQSFAIKNKIILKVENNIITTLDIYEEINNLKFFNKNLSNIDNEEIYQIAINSLTKYEVKKIEILKNFKKIELVNQKPVENIIQRTYEKLGFKELSDFKDELKKNDINFQKYKEKLEVQILWNQIIYQKYNKKITVNEKEILEKIKSRDAKNKSFNLSEIIFQIEEINNLENFYQEITEYINKFGFENAALKYSISDTASNGGELDWVDEDLLNDVIVQILNKLENGAITKPIRISSGFLILKKKDIRENDKKIDVKEELVKVINFEKEKQLSSYSNLYFNKVSKDLKINEP